MSRRGFLKLLGLGGSAGALGGFAHAAPPQEERPILKVGSLDLAELEIIDGHVHPPNPMTLQASYEGWNGSFVNALLPEYEYEHKEELRGKLWGVFEKHIQALPRQTGYNNYMARVYGVEPTLEGFDSVLSKKIQGDFTAYIRSILDREKIAAVLLQSRGSEPVRPESHIPSDRFVWSYSIGDLIQPDWAKKQGATDVEDVVEGIDRILEACASHGCVGIKIPIAYQRPISVEKVERDRANQDLQALLRDAEAPGLRSYQDYLLRHMFIKAGELDLRVIIHTAVGLHPALRFDWNSPLGLYSTFQDDEIKRVETEFVLIHTGYPLHHHVAAFISQFPNVHTDVSFYAKFPGILEETLRAFLSLAPSEQTMHGSDSNNVPEEIGYCADNMRRVMAKVLNDFRSHYGWTRKDCEKIARNVFSENARRIYGIKL
ncbi:MAG: amidohydrolase family protein [Vicinamibacteria bacterium]